MLPWIAVYRASNEVNPAGSCIAFSCIALRATSVIGS
jgi:hypothetical protein